MRERQIACDTAQYHAEPFDRGLSQSLMPVGAAGPDIPVLERVGVASVFSAEGLVYVRNSRPRGDSLDRHPVEPSAKRREQAIFERIDRSEADVSALARHDTIVAILAPQLRHPQPGPGSDDRNRTPGRQRLVGPAQMLEIIRSGLSHGMADSLKIIDQHQGVEPQLAAQRSTIDPPR